MTLDNRNIVVLGAGESGVGAAVLAKTKGYNVFVSDKGAIKDKYKNILNEENIRWEEKTHSEEIILCADEVIKSPGIPDKVELIKKIKARSIPVISEIEFAGRYTNAKTICITGSNGKTTTSMLLYHVLKENNLNVALTGNVGMSMAMDVAKNSRDYYVVELSSFQLDDMHDFKIDIAILLNITPDHLDRYASFDDYAMSKMHIYDLIKDGGVFLYNSDDEVLLEKLPVKLKDAVQNIPFSIERELNPGGFLHNGKINVLLKEKEFDMYIEEMALQGKHNIYNSLAASLAARIEDIKNPELRKSFMSFKSVEHRLEPVMEIKGVKFINDSKATNINSTWYALECMTKPVVWIVGGVDKGNDYLSLMDFVKSKVKAIVCLGVDCTPVHKAYDGVIENIEDTTSMEDAVKKSFELAESGDVVLLSPACASFDLFRSYEHRGTEFKECVRNL